MLLSELEAIVKEQRKLAKKAGVDPEVRVLVMPNFPTAVSLRASYASSLDSSLSKGAKAQGNFLYLAELRDEGAVWGEFIERVGWDERKGWTPVVEGMPEPAEEDEDPNEAIVAEETPND